MKFAILTIEFEHEFVARNQNVIRKLGTKAVSKLPFSVFTLYRKTLRSHLMPFSNRHCFVTVKETVSSNAGLFETH